MLAIDILDPCFKIHWSIFRLLSHPEDEYSGSGHCLGSDDSMKQGIQGGVTSDTSGATATAPLQPLSLKCDE